MLCNHYPIQWHRGKGTWSAWLVGLPVVAMDTTKAKTGGSSIGPLKFILSVSLSDKCHCLDLKLSL